MREVMEEARPPITQHGLAKLVGVTQPAVRGWLEGTIPYPRTLNRLCVAIGVHRDWLLYGEGDKYFSKEVRARLAEMPQEYNLQEKITWIEERGTPRQIAMVDSFLESVRELLGGESRRKPEKRTRRSSK